VPAAVPVDGGGGAGGGRAQVRAARGVPGWRAHGAWRDPQRVAEAAAEPHPAAVDATIAYCDYVCRRYHRFPAYPPPFRTVLGFQAGHVDPEFYDRHYHPGALSETHRRHLDDWHGGGRDADP
jgi:hypothetical protein